MSFGSVGQYAPAYQRPDYVQPQTMPAIQTQPPFVCRPVASREEAVAAQTEFFSQGTVMPDLGHGVIYLKRFNQQTGASDFYAFALQQEAPPPEPPAYATAQEVAELREEISRLKKGKVKKNEPDDE